MNNGQLRTIFDRFGNDPAEFRRCLFIEADGETVRLANVLDDWQDSDFAATDPGWLRCTGRGKGSDAKTRVYLERPRGHSKTADIAVMVVWALAFSPRQINGFAFAKDREQAKLLRDSIQKLIRLNEWLEQIIEVQNYRVVVTHKNHPGRDSELQILSSDVGGSYGILPDFIVADELSNWPDSAEHLWHSILSSAAKKSACMLLCISNAGRGMGTSWTWNVREQCRESEDWYFSRLDGPRASWIGQKQLAEQRRALPPKVFARLWLNQWQVESGDALDHEAVRRCITLDGPHSGQQEHYVYVASVDFSLTRDWTALVILGLNLKTGMIDVADMKNWNPKQYGGRLHLGTVKDEIIQLCRRFKVRKIMIDPWQAERLREEFSEAGFTISVWSSQSDRLHKQAVCLLDMINDERIAFYPDKLLIDDLMRARIDQQRSNDKYKITWPRTETGHCDRGAALVQALPWCKRILENLLFSRRHPIPEERIYA